MSRSDDWEVVVIRPRDGVAARDIADWLESNFQRPAMSDAGPSALQRFDIAGGNPLINARIKVAA